jgi:hypothetical protein
LGSETAKSSTLTSCGGLCEFAQIRLATEAWGTKNAAQLASCVPLSLATTHNHTGPKAFTLRYMPVKTDLRLTISSLEPARLSPIVYKSPLLPSAFFPHHLTHSCVLPKWAIGFLMFVWACSFCSKSYVAFHDGWGLVRSSGHESTFFQKQGGEDQM